MSSNDNKHCKRQTLKQLRVQSLYKVRFVTWLDLSTATPSLPRSRPTNNISGYRGLSRVPWRLVSYHHMPLIPLTLLIKVIPASARVSNSFHIEADGEEEKPRLPGRRTMHVIGYFLAATRIGTPPSLVLTIRHISSLHSRVIVTDDAL